MTTATRSSGLIEGLTPANVLFAPSTSSDGNKHEILSSLPVFSPRPDVTVPSHVTSTESTNGIAPRSAKRSSCAWIPSAATQQEIAKAQSSSPINRSRSICPRVKREVSMDVPSRELVRKYLGESEAIKKATKLATLPETEETLNLLLGNDNLRAAVDLSAKLLDGYKQGFHQTSKQPIDLCEPSARIWTARLCCLCCLGEYELASSELDAFGDLDSPDAYYQYFPEKHTGLNGSAIPFALRLLHAEVPQRVLQPNVSLSRLYYLKQVIQMILDNLRNGFLEDGSCKDDAVPGTPPPPATITIGTIDLEESQRLWTRRLSCVLCSIANCFFRLREYRLAFETYESIPRSCPKLLTPLQTMVLYSMIGRLSLKMGDQGTALRLFDQSKKVALPATNEAIVRKHSLINKAYLCIFHDNYAEAYNNIQSARQISSKDDEIVLTNNAAVCLLYRGQFGQAIQLLEGVNNHPDQGLQEGLILNLCTLYELSCGKSIDKKISLLRMVHEHCGDAFDAKSLKMPS